MEKYTYRNYNPLLKNEGDCVLRSFAAYFDGELDYDTIKKEILKYDETGSKIGYRKSCNFEKFAKEAGLVRVESSKYYNMAVSTYNRAIMFAKQFRVAMICISNTHAAYIDYEDGLVDTWDSRGKHMDYFYIHRDDALMLGLQIEEKNGWRADEVADSKTWFELKGRTFNLVKELNL